MLTNPFVGEKGFWLYSRLFLLSLILLPLTNPNNLHWWGIAFVCLTSLGVIVVTKERTFGNVWLWVGLAIIGVVSLFNNTDLVNISLFPIYGLVLLASLQLRVVDGSKMLSIFVVLQTIGVFTLLFITPNTGNGGFIDPISYNLATGLTVIAFLFSYKKWMWWVLPIMIVGIVFTSSEEALIVLGVLGIGMLVRRDWSKKIWLTLGAIGICIIALFGFHQPSYLYKVASNQLSVVQGNGLIYQTDAAPDVTRGRIEGWTLSITSVTLLGHSFNPKWFTADTIHNIFLRVLYDVGVIGLTGFLFIFLLWSKQAPAYFLLAMLPMMLLDHFFWTHVGIWFWAILGLSYNMGGFSVFKPRTTPT